MERFYENAILIELSKVGIKAINQVPIHVKCKEQIIEDYKLDVAVEVKVMLELSLIQDYSGSCSPTIAVHSSYWIQSRLSNQFR